jgi:hypothetical protein
LKESRQLERLETVMEHASHSNGSSIASKEARRLSRVVEALNNLVYLAKREAQSAEQVYFYMRLAEQQVAVLADMVRKKSAR